MEPRAPMTAGYARQTLLAKAMHPEMCSDAPDDPATLTSLANNLSGQLDGALERAARIIDRIVGPEPDSMGADKCPTPNSLDNVMAENVRRAGWLLAQLDRIESRIGG